MNGHDLEQESPHFEASVVVHAWNKPATQVLQAVVASLSSAQTLRRTKDLPSIISVLAGADCEAWIATLNNKVVILQEMVFRLRFIGH
jgi:hypothetical protein